jgi:hypothetical protein
VVALNVYIGGRSLALYVTRERQSIVVVVSLTFWKVISGDNMVPSSSSPRSSATSTATTPRIPRTARRPPPPMIAAAAAPTAAAPKVWSEAEVRAWDPMLL